MTQGIYISAMTPLSGKTLVALGLTDTMFKRTDALGFFRPVFDGTSPEEDSVLQLMKRTFDLPDSRCRGAVSLERCREILASGEHDDLDSAAMAVYSELAREFGLEEAAIVKLASNENPLGPSPQGLAAAQAALDRALAAGGWERAAELHFEVPVHYADFADFERRMLDVTYAERHLGGDLRQRVRARFEAHVGPGGAHFTRPMFVRLLRRSGGSLSTSSQRRET